MTDWIRYRLQGSTPDELGVVRAINGSMYRVRCAEEGFVFE